MRLNRRQTGSNGRAAAEPAARATALVALTACTLLAASAAALTHEMEPLRLCADPTNLPFSSDNAAQPGFYLEIGQALSRELGRPVTYDWYKSYFGKRTVRVTLLGKQCDAMIGLPLSADFMGPAVIFSKKIATETYALVSRETLVVHGIDDLRGMRVAVQYQTTPQNLLAQRDDIEKVTVLTPDEGLAALAQRKVDIAFVWGPVAGWLNKTAYQSSFRIQPVEGDGLSWDAAIGLAKSSTQLRDQIDAALPKLAAGIAELAVKYGLPSEPSIRLGAVPRPIRLASLIEPARLLHQPVAESVVTRVSDSTAGHSKTEAVTLGKEIFNGTCAHCHGPDAVQAERRIDLRRLQTRYGEDMRDKYWTTVHEGRPSKGMPAWKEVFTDDQFESIYSFLLTVQTSETAN
ncbi:transporter substrate-binding domain-containing protein [Bradyrhizobium sp. 83012]|uniref:Transporter substrate-binding domain-containing protein n=1 Tax=Bradyrhizobium aeschynomenes TaxID=2734909 RepID=A0ABX2C7V4_9BRAD|nr:transporter substrate-binding domain-containing protein [Bradyrhizobium aeschynomenes]NPU64334.1 transporter substrate-binding domain-containing protein [Bradyrhizobium aeschynomenes]